MKALTECRPWTLSNVKSLPKICRAFCSSSSPVITATSSYLRLAARASSSSRAESFNDLGAASPFEAAVAAPLKDDSVAEDVESASLFSYEQTKMIKLDPECDIYSTHTN